MSSVSPENWQTLEPLLDRALELEPEERARWLNELSAESPDLARELTAFLDEEALADRRGFLTDSPDVSLAGAEFGSWRLERPLGQGGMGSVWLASRADGRFEGHAAMKLLNLAQLSSTGQQRFRREGSVLARLTHPGIARLLDAGLADMGQPYLVLEYVDGKPIDQYAIEHELSAAGRIRLFLQVLAAVGHAHAHLVVHRDLKPSNILVTADGTVKLLDFGIAKLIDDDTGAEATAITMESGRVFTPQYAAPEQVRGELLTTTTDVYALGVLLYVLLSGRHPTGEASHSPAEMVQAVLQVEPKKLGMGDLDTILGKALAKPPGERYQTAAAFADDLQRYLRREPVSARAHSRLYRIGKFVRRNRAAVAAGIVVAAGLLGATAFAMTQAKEARLQRDAALQEREWADAQVEFQGALLSTVGDEPMTMREIVDAGREILETQYADNPGMMVPLLLQLSSSYAALGDRATRGGVLAHAESLALAGHGTEDLALIRCHMASNHRMLGEYDEAVRVLDVADSLFRESPNPGNEAFCLGIRSHLFAEINRGPEAISSARRAIAIRDSLGQTRDANYLGLLSTLSVALTSEDRHREAAATNRRAIAAMDASGRGATIDRAIMRHNLALVLGRMGQADSAERILHEMLEVTVGNAHTGPLPWQPLIHYAEAALTQDHADSARKYFDLIVRQALSDTNLYWEGRGLFGRARAETRLGNLDEARRARERLAEIIAVYPHVRDTDDQIPDASTLDGWIALAEGDTLAARAAFIGALRANGYYEGKYQRRLMPVALLAAESAVATGDFDGALSLARGAREIAAVDSLANFQSAYVGEARLIEARALMGQGKTREARAAAEQALVALRYGAGDTHRRVREARDFVGVLERTTD